MSDNFQGYRTWFYYHNNKFICSFKEEKNIYPIYTAFCNLLKNKWKFFLSAHVADVLI